MVEFKVGSRHELAGNSSKGNWPLWHIGIGQFKEKAAVPLPMEGPGHLFPWQLFPWTQETEACLTPAFSLDRGCVEALSPWPALVCFWQ